ncbi:MAG: hypothetical protein IKX47_03370 [Oscillospiraceae bacterium]|nr:hypothetical protein [Oscillospiraceae bacterium]
MFFRLARFRLQAEWTRILLGVALVSLILTFSGWFNAPPGGKYAYFNMVQDYKNNYSGQEPIGMEPGADTWESFQILLRENRGTFYTAIEDGTENLAWIGTALLGVLLLTGPFARRRLGPLLSAGVSRGGLFLSLTLVYYGAVILVWFLSSRALMALFQVSFSPEEQGIRMTLQQAWLFAILVRAALVYMASFLLARPLPAALASLGGCILLSVLKSYIPAIPIGIMDYGMGGPDAWFTALCQDLSSMETGNRVALAILVLSLAVGWLGFRKRTVE